MGFTDFTFNCVCGGIKFEWNFRVQWYDISSSFRESGCQVFLFQKFSKFCDAKSRSNILLFRSIDYRTEFQQIKSKLVRMPLVAKKSHTFIIRSTYYTLWENMYLWCYLFVLSRSWKINPRYFDAVALGPFIRKSSPAYS